MAADVPYAALQLSEEAAFYMRAYEYHFTGQEALLTSEGEAGRYDGPTKEEASVSSTMPDVSVVETTPKDVSGTAECSLKLDSGDAGSTRWEDTTLRINGRGQVDALVEPHTSSIRSKTDRDLDAMATSGRVQTTANSTATEIPKIGAGQTYTHGYYSKGSNNKMTRNLSELSHSSVKKSRRKKHNEKAERMTKHAAMATRDTAESLDLEREKNESAAEYVELKMPPRQKKALANKVFEREFRNDGALVVIGSRQPASVSKATIQPFERKSSSLAVVHPFAPKSGDGDEKWRKKQGVGDSIDSAVASKLSLVSSPGKGGGHLTVSSAEVIESHRFQRKEKPGEGKCSKKSKIRTIRENSQSPPEKMEDATKSGETPKNGETTKNVDLHGDVRFPPIGDRHCRVIGQAATPTAERREPRGKRGCRKKPDPLRSRRPPIIIPSANDAERDDRTGVVDQKKRTSQKHRMKKVNPSSTSLLLQRKAHLGNHNDGKVDISDEVEEQIQRPWPWDA